MLFESDYEGLKAEHVKSALEDDPRLILLDSQEILEIPVAKLAAKYGLVASNGIFLFPVIPTPNQGPHIHLQLPRRT